MMHKHTVLLCALVVLAVAALVVQAQDPDPLAQFVANNCGQIIQTLTGGIVDTCAQLAGAGPAGSAVCSILQMCGTSLGPLGALLGGGLFGR